MHLCLCSTVGTVNAAPCTLSLSALSRSAWGPWAALQPVCCGARVCGCAAGDWPARRRSLTFLHSRSQALDVELRSCSLKDLRSFSFASEFLLEVIANPPVAHNNQIIPLVPAQTDALVPRSLTEKFSISPFLFLFPFLSFKKWLSITSFFLSAYRSSNASVNILRKKKKS